MIHERLPINTVSANIRDEDIRNSPSQEHHGIWPNGQPQETFPRLRRNTYTVPREVCAAQKTRELRGGIGADVIFDAAGVEKAFVGAIPACRVQGTIVNIAVWEKSPSLPVNELMYNDVRYTGAALFDESTFLDTIRR